jgi:hypothetical protein
MDEEFQALQSNNTWELTKLPDGKKTIGCKWIFKQKRDEAGNVIKYKARLVALGCCQKYGNGYDEVFAPVVKQVTFRTMLSVANEKKMLVKHIDVKTAYLYGELEEEIFMKQPLGYIKDNFLVCKLKRSIYGLKQAAKIWNSKLDSVLNTFGFIKSVADPCLYTKSISGKLIFLLIYVDDIVLSCYNESQFIEIVKYLSQHFKLTVIGDLKFFLGIQIEKINDCFALNQKQFIQKMIQRFGIKDSKTSKIPMDPGFIQQKEENDCFENPEIYQSLIGSLLYTAVNTRPDISISVSILGRRVVNPSNADWAEAKRILKYLKSTIDIKLILKPSNNYLKCFVDADWANDSTDRKSNTGFLCMLGESLITWCSRKQQCVSLSSTEAEFIALAECCQEVLWIEKLTRSFGINLKIPIEINEDNQSCIKVAENSIFERKSKHIETKYCFVKDLVRNKKIKLLYCPTESMIADIMTKPLHSTKIMKFRDLMGLKDLSH